MVTNRRGRRRRQLRCTATGRQAVGSDASAHPNVCTAMRSRRTEEQVLVAVCSPAARTDLAARPATPTSSRKFANPSGGVQVKAWPLHGHALLRRKAARAKPTHSCFLRTR